GIAERQEGRSRGRWLALLMFGAFLAGLLIVGGVFLLSGPGSPPSPDAPLPAAQAPQVSAARAVPPSPAASPPPRLAIVVDDLGYDPSRDAEWLHFPARITVAVLPFGPSSRQIAESAKAKGWGVILHIPMEPESPASDRTEGFRIRRGMTADAMESLLTRMFENVPQASGASNHMGSAVTADPEAMEAVASILARKGYFLLDSVTTPGSVALDAARKAGIPAARRDVFLDPGMNEEETRRQWERALSIAREKGTAVLVCHGSAETLRRMLELLPRLGEEKVQAVTLEELLRERTPRE
ncbi:MAG: hypothetical protein C3F14_08195, partial [Deltaproteobacteria bacterium]